MKLILIALIGIFLINSHKEKIEVKENFKEDIKEEISIENNQEKEVLEIKQTSKKENIEEKITNEEEIVTKIEQPSIKEAEKEVVMYFESQDIESESKLKEAYQKIKAFINNETTIKGYTFKELTEEAKQKIISLYNTIDNKIETKYPNYKEKTKEKIKEIPSKAKETYNEAKEKVNNYIDSKLTEEEQEEIKDSFKEGANDLKESVINAKDVIKGILKGE